MVSQISVVINTFNEEKNIKRAISSVNWADEVIVCDMYSDDRTKEIAKKLGAKIVLHKRVNYVEPARNFAISRASKDWILILDADEEVPPSLGKRLQELAAKFHQINFVEIPRKNIIFGKVMKASFWWPDNQIRFFKKGTVLWSDKIHSKPKTEGEGLTLPPKEELAIIHYNYQTISQFIERLNRYSTIEAKALVNEGYKFTWKDLVQKPVNEYLSRFFANEGYKDGIHGFALSLLQAVSFLAVYLKVWELEKFKEENISLSDVNIESKKVYSENEYWLNQTKSQGVFKKFLKVLKRK